MAKYHVFKARERFENVPNPSTLVPPSGRVSYYDDVPGGNAGEFVLVRRVPLMNGSSVHYVVHTTESGKLCGEVVRYSSEPGVIRCLFVTAHYDTPEQVRVAVERWMPYYSLDGEWVSLGEDIMASEQEAMLALA